MNNKKGVILSTYVYILLVFFLLLLASMLAVLNNTKILSNKVKETSLNNDALSEENFSINLNGDSEMILFKGTTYTEPGYVARTNTGESLTARVEGTVNKNKEGSYKITYTVKYKGKSKSRTRIVTVIERVKNYSYTGNYQKFTASATGWYEIELWGASGGKNIVNAAYSGANFFVGGKGGYTSGIIKLNKGEIINVYVGGAGSAALVSTIVPGGWNGGGTGDHDHSDNESAGGGGGATDIRYNDTSLNSRIMVAGGGGGAAYNAAGGNGGFFGGNTTYSKGGTQTTGYSFGNGQNGVFVNSNVDVAGGGGGWYGGEAKSSGKSSTYKTSGAGGSSYISGYAGVNSINSSGEHTNNTLHYSGKYFIDAKMYEGVNEGNGKATITFISENKPKKGNVDLNDVQYLKDCIHGSTSANADTSWVEFQAISDGINVAKNKPVVGDIDTDYSYVTDGDISYENWAGIHQDLYQCITIDLGSKYDLDEIVVWHYWVDGRTYYDHTTFVSSNGAAWITVINTDEAETSEGMRFSAYSTRNFEYILMDRSPGEYGIDYIYHETGIHNWKIEFLTSGIFIPLVDMNIDAFLVGGGGGGGAGGGVGTRNSGGGGGYTKTFTPDTLHANTEYTIVVGDGGIGGGSGIGGTGIMDGSGNNGEATSAFGESINGGIGGSGYTANTGGGAGGSGGGSYSAGTGGSNGSNGTGSKPGVGQGSTTREFGMADGKLYSGGGGASVNGAGGAGGGGKGSSARGINGDSGIANTGGGGGSAPDGDNAGGKGGSGIVVIRNSQT